MNRKISIKSIIATITFLALSIILGLSIHFHGWKADTPVFWFLAVLLIGTLLSVIVCVANIDKRIDLYTKITDQEDSKKIKLTTCPNYWTKHIVLDPTTQKPITMCFNMYDHKFIDGPLSQSDASGQYQFPDTSIFRNSNINDLREMRQLPYSDTRETFVLQNQQGLTMTDESKYRHTHYTKLIADESSDENPFLEPHSHEYNVGLRWHSHGPSWDDDLEMTTKFEYSVTDSNFDNWINPFVHDELTNGNIALEINLNQLNSADNVCSLVKKIPWTEASIKCKDVKF